MGNILINDTCDAVLRRKSDGHVVLTAETHLASISQTLGINERILGGIGNKTIAIMRGQKEVTTTLRNALFDLEFLSMTQGVAVEENGEATVYHREEELKVVDNDGDLTVTISGTPANEDVYLRNESGQVQKTAAEGSVVTVPSDFASVGDTMSATYQKDITGQIVEMDAEKFSEAYEVEYHTIGYDPRTHDVVKDIYIQLDHVTAQGEFELGFENGTALAPEFVFDALTPPNSSKIGRIIQTNRNSTP